MPPASTKSRQRFRALDACRGLCAVIVVLYHLDALTHWYWLPVVRNGYVAVDFFFVLSGFVIASAYYDRLSTAADSLRFAIRRFGRLYPLHLVVLTVYLAIELWRLFALRADDAFTDNTSLSSFIQQLLLVQGFTGAHESWNYPAWSISVELWVNLAFGLAALMLGRRLLAFVLVLLAAGAALVYAQGQISLSTNPALADALWDAIRSSFEFFLGVAAFALFKAARSLNWQPPAMTEFLALPLAVLAFGFADALPSLGLPAIFFALVFLFAFEAGVLSRLLRRGLLQSLGAWSYSIYLTHSLYLLALEGILFAIAQHLKVTAGFDLNGDTVLALGGPWAMDAAALACVAATIIGSSVTYRVLEEPARLFFNRLSNRRPAKARAGHVPETSPA